VQGIDIVLIDGHQIAAGQAIAQVAKANNIPVIIDGGSWKPGFETVLPWADYAICSAISIPVATAPRSAYLSAAGISHIAITHGEEPIHLSHGKTSAEVPEFTRLIHWG